MYKPVENEAYSVDQDGEWFRVLYSKDTTRFNRSTDPIAHYKTKEKADCIADILNQHKEL